MRCMTLEKKLRALDEQMAVDPRYITRVTNLLHPAASNVHLSLSSDNGGRV